MNRAPDPDEIELVLFGPGYGECCVIHVGAGRWIVVDSCLDSESNQPVALSYLSRLGVDPASQIDLVVATHWHDDHIRGLGRLFAAAKSASFACPAALGKREFFELLATYGKAALLQSTGVDEMREVFKELEHRSATTGSVVRPVYAIEGRRIAMRTVGGKQLVVDALSPSDEALERSLLRMGHMLPKPTSAMRRAHGDRPNDTALVIRLEIGEKRFLLGSDLEVTKSMAQGWVRVIEAAKGGRRAHVVKVPHHGSKSGHLDEMWETMVEGSAIALMTPFVRGSQSLPSEDDIKRLSAYTPRAYLTSPTKRMRAKFSDRLVQRLVEQTTSSPVMRAIVDYGAVRTRSRHDSEEWTVELFGNAVECTGMLPTSAVA